MSRRGVHACRGLWRLPCQCKELSRRFSGDAAQQVYHRPVMLQECMDHLQPCAGKLFVDGTLGGGGHTAAVLETGAHVISIDQDDDAIETSSRRLQSYLSCQQLEIRKGNFRSIEHIVSTSRLFQGRPVDGILLDLGMSSHQIDVGSRGFSFQNDGPLDMRMDKEGSSATTALDIVNSWTGDQLADLFYQFGGEGNSRKIAREIIASRPIKTTQQLSTVICRQTPSPITQKTLARCFQALRIFINDEMGALDTVLIGAVRCLKPGGVLCVLSYHSLEDRRVKLAFQNKYPEQFEFSLNAPVSVPIDDYISLHQDFCWEPIKKKAILPSKVEVKENSRARSAKLRAAIKRDKWS